MPKESNPSDVTSDSPENASLWPVIAIGALLFVILLLLARPCEMLRIRAVVTEAAFGPSNTVCAPVPNIGCRCMTTDSGMMMFENGRTAGSMMKATEVTPEVTF